MKPPRMLAFAALLSVLAASATTTSSRADHLGPDSTPGHSSHRTLLETVENDCFEIPVPRAANFDAARAVVPARYSLPTPTGTPPPARILMWDVMCTEVSVDGQRNTRATQISMGGVVVNGRDGVPLSGTHVYLLWFETDNPVLAARYNQVGLPAVLNEGMTAHVDDVGTSPFVVSFKVPGANAHTVSSSAAAAPLPVALPSPATPSLFLHHESPDAEVEVVIRNTRAGGVPAVVTADLRELGPVVPLILRPQLLQINGPFPIGSVRVAMTSTATQLR